MIKNPLQKTFFIFWVLVFMDLFSIGFGFVWLHTVVKPLLMPVLIASFLYPRLQIHGKKIILAGLFFSWLGDVFLLFDSVNPSFFIAGLVSFLITHIFYIIYFGSVSSDAPSLLKKQPVFIVLMNGLDGLTSCG